MWEGQFIFLFHSDINSNFWGKKNLHQNRSRSTTPNGLIKHGRKTKAGKEEEAARDQL